MSVDLTGTSCVHMMLTAIIIYVIYIFIYNMIKYCCVIIIVTFIHMLIILLIIVYGYFPVLWFSNLFCNSLLYILLMSIMSYFLNWILVCHSNFV